MNYIVFADESYVTGSRFAGLSAISMPFKYRGTMTEEVGRVLGKNDVSEFKWNRVRNWKYYRCAEDVVDLIFHNLKKFDLRIDTLVWCC